MNDSTENTSATPRLDALVEILLIALLTFLPAALGTIDAWSELIALAVGGLLAVLLVIRIALNHEPQPRRWIVVVPIVCFLLLAIGQLLPLPAEFVRTIAPRNHELKTQLLDDLPNAHAILARMTVSFYTLATRHDLRVVLLAITVLATVMTVHRNPRRMRRLLAAITLIALATALLALAQDVSSTYRIYWRIPIGELARSGPFVNHSHFGQFMNMSIGAALALLLTMLMPPESSQMPSRSRIIAAALVGGVIALGWLTIALSLTRGGMISAAAAGAFVVFTLTTRRQLRWLAAVLLLIAIATAAVLWQFGAEGVVARMQSADFGGSRGQMAIDIWRMSHEFPIIGTGLGTFEWVFAAYDHSMSLSTAAYADNDYLQLLAETGWVGVVIVLSFVAIVWTYFVRAIRNRDRTTAATAIGLAYGLVAVMIHSLSDFGQHLPANACLSAVACGLIINLGSGSPRPTASRRGVAVSLGIVVLSFGAWVIADAVKSSIAEANWRPAGATARTLEQQDWSGNERLVDSLQYWAETALKYEPGDAHRRYHRAVYAWRIARRKFVRNSPELLAAARDVVDQLNAARALCPTYGAPYAVLGQIEYSYLNLPIGITHIRTAAQLDLNDPTSAFTVGRIDARRGRFAEANEQFRRALDLAPGMMEDITELYLDELHEPQAAIDMADDNYYRCCQVGNALMHRHFKELGEATYNRGVELHASAALRRQNVDDLIYAGNGSNDLQHFAIAEELFKAALNQDPSRIDGLIGLTKAYIGQKRWIEAEQTLQSITHRAPNAPELPGLQKRLDDARK